MTIAWRSTTKVFLMASCNCCSSVKANDTCSTWSRRSRSKAKWGWWIFEGFAHAGELDRIEIVNNTLTNLIKIEPNVKTLLPLKP
eukprot:4328686-Amphidinium_carterae.1